MITIIKIFSTAPNLHHFIQPLIFAAILLSANSLAGGGHPHGGVNTGYDDHSDEPAIVYTHYTEATELFVEFPPLVANQPSIFVAHLTRMDNFKPLTAGVLDILLKQNNKTTARFRVKSPARTGIFLPSVTAKTAGKYQLVLEVRDGDLHAIHDLGEIEVSADAASVKINQAEPEGEISYLKEQQWLNPFAITKAQTRPMRTSVPGFATVSAPADGFAIVRAPSDGYFNTQNLLNAGANVSLGQLLGSLTPRLGDGADIGNLQVNLEKARAQQQLAESDVKRLQGLFDQGAIPEKRLLEAQQNLEVARVELKTSQSRLTQQTGKTSQAGIALTAPIAGELVDVTVRPSSFVRAGDVLFTITEPTRRWLDIQIPEKFGQHIQQISGVWFADTEQTQVLDYTTGAKLVKLSKQINPSSRTLNAAIEYPSQNGPRLLGARLPVNVYTTEPQEKLAVPVSAVIDDGGQPVVYIQSGGETFARKPVVLGIQDGHWVEILQGISASQWVVSDGAYYVKLASTGGDAIGHGHAH